MPLSMLFSKFSTSPSLANAWMASIFLRVKTKDNGRMKEQRVGIPFRQTGEKNSSKFHETIVAISPTITVATSKRTLDSQM